MSKRKVEDTSLEGDTALAKAEVDTKTKAASLAGEEENTTSSEEEDAAHDESNKSGRPPSKKQRRYLSAQEIQVARETAELFKSNLFKLQIDELIQEIKLKESHVEKIEKVLHRLHDLISRIPATSQMNLAEAENSLKLKKITIPFPDPKPTKVNYSFAYLPPEDVSLVGSFGLKTRISSSHRTSVDIALTMPRELFQPKDYMNYRALYKRAFYLAHVADNLIPLSKKNNLPIKVSYHYLNDDVLCPVLKIESIQTDNPEDLIFSKTKISVNLIVGFPFGIFDSKKMLLDKNCIRVQSDVEDLPATPIYNSSILSSTSYEYYLKYLYTAKKSAESFKDACILGRLWLEQRGFGSSFSKGGFGHFEFAMLVSALLNGGGLEGNKILLHGFSSYQLFKGAVKYLATIDLSAGHLTFSSLIGENFTSKYVPDDGLKVPTIFDKNSRLNILWKMSHSSYSHLQYQAKETLRLLNDVVKDRFDSILLQKSDFDPMRFDMVLNLSVPDEVYESFGALEKVAFITFEAFFKNKLYFILKKALGARANLIHIRNEKTISTYPLAKRKAASSPNNYVIGICLNADECNKLVTRGPSNDDEIAGKEFRGFWGPRASLRRFKDGSISHCVVWKVENSQPVVLSVIKCALDLHFSREVSSHLVSDIEHFYKRLPTALLPSVSNQTVTSLTGFVNLRNSFESLSKLLSTMDLPLGIKAILPTSTSLRYSSLLQPVAFAVSNPDFWNDLVLQFEVSARWPDELSALEKTKTAFLIKMNEVLNSETTYRAFITKDDSIPFNEHISLLNILTPEGYGFRIRVLTERDEVLYLRAVNNGNKQKAILQDVYLQFSQKYVGAVKHTRTVSSLAHHFPYYSPTVRLFKRWLDSQLLLTHLTDELVELLALKPFVDPAPYSTPQSVESGFLQILNFLANWNWKEDSLILDLAKAAEDPSDVIMSKLTDRLSLQAHQMIEQNFKKIRQADPSGIKTQLFVGSKDDPSGILWSNNLILPISTRLTALSRAAIRLVKEEGLSENTLDLIFTPAIKDYDFVINLKSASLAISSGILPSNAYKNLVGAETSFEDNIANKYDLISCFYSELSKKFYNTIVFSTRKFSGLHSIDSRNTTVICGSFVPSSLGKKKFKVTMGMNVKPFEETPEEVIINKDAVLAQISMLGGEMVTSIQMNKK